MYEVSNNETFYLDVGFFYDVERLNVLNLGDLCPEVYLYILGLLMYEDVFKHTVGSIHDSSFRMVQTQRIEFKSVNVLKGQTPKCLLEDNHLYKWYLRTPPPIKCNYVEYLRRGILFNKSLELGLIIGETIADVFVKVRKV